VLPYITAHSWTIYDLNTKKFIQGKKENYKREIASITKMMTFYTCIKIMDKYNIDGSTVVTASRTASLTNGTSACLREGDQLTLE
jgi:D-alanyl-D-alanine carboxypeptidase